MQCKLHPKYKAIYPPRKNKDGKVCDKCQQIYGATVVDSFTVNPKEMAKFEAWRKKNKTPKHSPALGTIVDNFEWRFQRNGIGTSITVVDLITGKEIDITDIDSW